MDEFDDDEDFEGELNEEFGDFDEDDDEFDEEIGERGDDLMEPDDDDELIMMDKPKKRKG